MFVSQWFHVCFTVVSFCFTVVSFLFHSLGHLFVSQFGTLVCFTQFYNCFERRLADPVWIGCRLPRSSAASLSLRGRRRRDPFGGVATALMSMRCRLREAPFPQSCRRIVAVARRLRKAPFRRSCCRIASVARSLPRILFGGVAAAAFPLRDRRRQGPLGGAAAV